MVVGIGFDKVRRQLLRIIGRIEENDLVSELVSDLQCETFLLSTRIHKQDCLRFFFL